MKTKVWRQRQALDSHGKRCSRRNGLAVEQYHGNGELYGAFNEPWPSWVHVLLCEKHREPRAHRASPGSEEGGT